MRCRLVVDDAIDDDALLSGGYVEPARPAEPAAAPVATNPAVAERLQLRAEALVKKAAVIEEAKKQTAAKKAAKRAAETEVEDWSTLLGDEVCRDCVMIVGLTTYSELMHAFTHLQ